MNKKKGLNGHFFKQVDMGRVVYRAWKNVMIAYDQADFEFRLFFPPAFELLPLFIIPAVKKVSQNEEVLRINFPNQFIHFIDIGCIDLSGNGYTVFSEMS